MVQAKKLGGHQLQQVATIVIVNHVQLIKNDNLEFGDGTIVNCRVNQKVRLKEPISTPQPLEKATNSSHTYLLNGTDTDIKVGPSRPDLAAAKEADHTDRVLVRASPPQSRLVIAVQPMASPSGESLNNVTEPSNFLLN